MKFDDFLKSFLDILSKEKTGARAAVTLCADRMHAYEVLRDGPADAFRIALSLDGSEPADSTGEVNAGPVERVKITVAILRPMGLTLNAQRGLHTETAGGGISLLERADGVRKLLAGARWFIEPGVFHPDLNPAGLSWRGQRIIHLEKPDMNDDGLLGVVEQSWEMLMALDAPGAGDRQDIFFGSPWTLRDSTVSRTLRAEDFVNRMTNADTLTVPQTTESITLTVEGPTAGELTALNIQHTGTAAFTLMPGSITVEPGNHVFTWYPELGFWGL